MSNLTYKSSSDIAARHYLDGQPISCGQALDILTPLGWMAGRFELAHGSTQEGDPLIEDGKVPMFYSRLPVEKGGSYAAGSVGETCSFQISERHVFRCLLGTNTSGAPSLLKLRQRSMSGATATSAARRCRHVVGFVRDAKQLPLDR